MNGKAAIWYAQAIDNSGLRQGIAEANHLWKKTGDVASSEGMRIEHLWKGVGRTVGGALAGISVGGFVKQMFQVRASFQDAESAMTLFLGSADKAGKFMKELQDYAWYNAFEFEDLVAQSKQLLAYGNDVETVIPILDQLSNVAIATRQPLQNLVDLYNKAKNIGSIDSVGLKQWASAGLVVTDVLKEMGQEVDGSKVSFEQLEMVLGKVTGEGGRFHKQMEQMMPNLSMSLGQLQDDITNMFNELGQQTEGAMKSGIEFASTLVANYEKIGKALLQLIATVGTYKAAMAVNTAVDRVQLNLQYNAEIAELQKLLPLKNAEKNADLQAALASGKLTQAKYDHLVALRAEAAEMVNEVRLKYESAKAEQAAATVTHKAALQRALSSKSIVAQREMELSLAKLSGDAAQIELAQKALLEAQEERHIAVKARKATADQLAITKSKATAAATAIETVQQNVNTSATNAGTKAKTLFALATTRLTKAFKALGLAFKSNPIGMLATIVMSAASAMALFGKKTDEAADGIVGIARATKNATEEFGKEEAKIKTLTSIINNGNVSYEERNKKLKELKQIIPGYNAELSAEGVLINNNTESIKEYLKQLERQVKFKAAQEELEEAYKLQRQLKNQRKEQQENVDLAKQYKDSVTPKEGDSKVGSFLADALFSNTSVTNDATAALNRAQQAVDGTDEKLSKLEETIQELNREIETGAIQGGSGGATTTFAEQLSAASQSVKDLEQQLAKLRSGETPSDNYAQAITDKEKELKDAQAKLNTLFGVDPKRLKADANESQKYLEEYEKIVLAAHERLASEEIQLERDKIEDKIALIEFDRQQTVAAIEKTRDEALNAWMSSGNTAQSFNGSIFQDLIDHMNVRAQFDTDKETTDRLKSEQESWNEYYRKYGDFQEQVLAINKEYAAKIADAQNDGLTGQVEILKKELETEIAKLNLEGFTDTLFGDMDKQSSASLKAATESARKFIEILKNGVGNNPQLLDIIQKLEGAILNVNKNVKDRLPGGLKKSAQGLKQLAGLANQFSSSLGGAIDTLATMVDAFGDIHQGISDSKKAIDDFKTMEPKGVGDILGGVAAIGDAVGAAISGVASIISLFDNSAKKEAERARREQERLRQIESYWDSISYSAGKYRDILDDLSGDDHAEAIKKAMDTLNKGLDEAKKAAGTVQYGAGDVDNLLNAMLWGGTGKDPFMLEVYKQHSPQYISQLQKYVDAIRSGDVDNIAALKEQEDVWRLLPKDVQENIEKVVEYRDQLKELQEQIDFDTFQITSKSLEEAIVEGIKGGAGAIDDMGDYFEKVMRDSMLQSWVIEKGGLREQAEEFYDLYKELYGDGDMSADDLEILRKGWQDILDSAKEQGEGLSSVFGDLSDDSGRSASSKGIATASQDSVDELNGRMTVMQGYTFDIRAFNERIAVSNEAMLAQTSQIQSQWQQFQTHNAQVLRHLSGIETNTNPIPRMASQIEDIATRGIRIRE